MFTLIYLAIWFYIGLILVMVGIRCLIQWPIQTILFLGFISCVALTSCGSASDGFSILPGGDEFRDPVPLCDKYELEEHPYNSEAQQEAIDIWNAAIGKELLVLVKPPLMGDVGRISLSLVDYLETPEGKVVWAYGRWGLECTGHITMTPNGEDNWQTWAHEIGHVYGFRHTTNQQSIMYEHPNQGQITEAMVEEIQETLATNH